MPTSRDIAVCVVRTLRKSGRTAYFAGGCVRDELLGLHPADYDVATDAPPDEVRRLFRRANEVGASFGVVLVRLGGCTIEVTTFREEGSYTDRRRPDEVRCADAPSDARRRDFTINALYLDPLAPCDDADASFHIEGAVIDYVGGVADLKRRVIRAVGDPDQRLAEDHLRALRAIRFAARLGFSIDDATARAIHRHARQLQGVSRERLGGELRRMLQASTRATAVELIESLGLDGPTLNETPISDTGQRPAPRSTPPIVASLPADASLPLALSAWAIGRELARAGAGSGLEEIWGALRSTPTRWRAALCLSNQERDRLARILSLIERLAREWSGMGVAARKRLIATDASPDAMTLLALIDPTAADAVHTDAHQLANDGVGVHPEPLLTGDDLIRLGFTPGPQLGQALDNLYDLQLAGAIRSLDEAERRALTLRGEERHWRDCS